MSFHTAYPFGVVYTDEDHYLHTVQMFKAAEINSATG